MSKDSIVKRVAQLAHSPTELTASLEDILIAVTLAENDKDIENTVKAFKKYVVY